MKQPFHHYPKRNIHIDDTKYNGHKWIPLNHSNPTTIKLTASLFRGLIFWSGLLLLNFRKCFKMMHRMGVGSMEKTCGAKFFTDHCTKMKFFIQPLKRIISIKKKKNIRVNICQ